MTLQPRAPAQHSTHMDASRAAYRQCNALFGRSRTTSATIMRRGRRFVEKVVSYSAFLEKWLDEEAPADNDPRPVTVPSYAAGMAKIEWLIKKLIAVDPEGVDTLRMFQMRVMVEPRCKDEHAWSRIIVEAIDNCSPAVRRF